MVDTEEASHAGPDPAFYTPADNIVLRALYRDLSPSEVSSTSCNSADLDQEATTFRFPKSPDIARQLSEDLARLEGMNDASSPFFKPTVAVSWDYGRPETRAEAWNKAEWQSGIKRFRKRLLDRYVQWAQTIVRKPTDVVFLTHIILYFLTSVPSACYLFYSFTYVHGALHLLITIWYAGGFTLMLHNHIHGNGVLSKQYRILDLVFPYILEPLMGHTWDSYYYHHIKHHHIEGNGPDDISSTIRYQRDSIWALLHYEARFLFLTWIELPIYFMRRRKHALGLKFLFSELASYAMMGTLYWVNPSAALFVLWLPFLIMRLGLMLGNWGQHALVDEVAPSSDFRSSITLIDVPSNRFCFNDGYHTSHHLNPRRHWRDHPHAFLAAKARYAEEGALVFHNIDFLEITYRLMIKDYTKLARQLIPIGKQSETSIEEIAAMLKLKTRALSEEEIKMKFR